MDGSNNELLKIEAADTQCLTRILSVTDSAPSSVAGAVLKNRGQRRGAPPAGFQQLHGLRAAGSGQRGRLHAVRSWATDLAAEPSRHRASGRGDGRRPDLQLRPERPQRRQAEAEEKRTWRSCKPSSTGLRPSAMTARTCHIRAGWALWPRILRVLGSQA